MSDKEIEACPTQGGVTHGYKIEILILQYSSWKEIDLKKVEKDFGVPNNSPANEVIGMMDLCGYEQAMALAWIFQACHPFESVRIVPYKVTYDVKAYREEDKAFAVEHS